MLNISMDQLDEFKKTVLELEKVYPCTKDSKPVVVSVESKEIKVVWEANVKGAASDVQASLFFSAERKFTHAEMKVDSSFTWRPKAEKPKEATEESKPKRDK